MSGEEDLLNDLRDRLSLSEGADRLEKTMEIFYIFSLGGLLFSRGEL